MTTPATTAARGDSDHATLIGMTVPLMGNRWQRDRIVLGDMAEARANGGRAGMVGIALAQSDTPAIRHTAPSRVALTYDPAALGDARAALIAASAQGGWPRRSTPRRAALRWLIKAGCWWLPAPRSRATPPARCCGAAQHLPPA